MPMFKQTLHTEDYNCFDFPEKVMRSFCLSAYVYVIYVSTAVYILYIYIILKSQNIIYLQLWFHNNVTMDIITYINYMGNNI